MLTIPNILTVLRLILLVPMIGLFYSAAPWAVWTCFALYVIGAATDWFDGWIARKFNQISEFGIFLDPLSDKIYVVTVMLMLVATDRIAQGWAVCMVIILIREFTVAGVREYLGPKGIKVPVTKLAKWKTATQMVAIAVLILSPLTTWVAWLGLALLIAATILTVVTGWGYLKTGIAHMR
jgi:cardiolipin synthase